MAKQYKVKDINNNGKIDGWEQGKYDAINNSATKMYKKEKSPMKMGYSMKMGSKEIYTPTNFKTKDAMLMAQSPMMKTDPKNKSSEKGYDTAKEISLEGVTPSGGKKTSLSKDKIKRVIEDQKQYDKNIQRSMQNLAEIDSLKLVASGEGKKAKMLYGPKYTAGKKFQNPAYIQGSASYVDSKPNIKARIEKRKELKNKAINISGPRPSL